MYDCNISCIKYIFHIIFPLYFMYHFLDLKLKIILPNDSKISVPTMTPLGTLTDDEINDEYTVLILYLLKKN